MGVAVSMVLLSSATLPTMAAIVIRLPSHAPPMSRAAVEKYPSFHCCQLPSAASAANGGRK